MSKSDSFNSNLIGASRALVSGGLAMLVLSVALFAVPQAVTAGEMEDKLKVIDQFIEHVKQIETLSEEQRDNVVAMVTEFRNDEFSVDFAVTEGLSAIYPEFRNGLEALGAYELDEARQQLGDASESADLYLAADATYYLARAAIYDEHYEICIPMLDRILTDLNEYSVQGGNATYFKGMAQAALLRRDDAKQTLETFIAEYPNAPERMRISAERRMYELNLVEDGSLFDVFERMDYSRRRLELEMTDEPTQTQQDEIVKMLDKLVKQAEDSECQGGNCNKPGDSQGQNQSQGQGQGQGQNNSGAGSNNPDGYARRTFGDGPQSPWSELRDRTRDPAFNAIKEKYPARYQRLIEQYYRSFQDAGSN